MDITILRHGKTTANLRHVYSGRRSDDLLSEAGITEAKALGTDPALRRVYITPLRRTAQTAALLFPNAEQVIVADLAEMDFGAFEGRSYKDMEDDADYRAWVDGMCEAPCPGGESRALFEARVCTAFDRLVREAAARGEQRMVVVGHGGTIMSVMDRFVQSDRSYYEWLANNCGGYRFAIDPGAWATHPLIKDPVKVDGPGPDQYREAFPVNG